MLAVLRANGDVDCLLHIDEWNFDWQGEYFLAVPVTLEFGDRLYVESHFDNARPISPTAVPPRIYGGCVHVTMRDHLWGIGLNLSRPRWS